MDVFSSFNIRPQVTEFVIRPTMSMFDEGDCCNDSCDNDTCIDPGCVPVGEPTGELPMGPCDTPCLEDCDLDWICTGTTSTSTSTLGISIDPYL